MEYVFNDREDLEEVQGLRDKVEACVDMINTYAEKLGYTTKDVQPDRVVISTALNARELYCMLHKGKKRLYCIELCQLYGFGGSFYCKSDLHQAAETIIAHIKDEAARVSKKKQSIKLGGA